MDREEELIRECIEDLRTNGTRDESFLSKMGKPENIEKMKPHIKRLEARAKKNEESVRQNIIEANSFKGIETTDAELSSQVEERQHEILMRHIEQIAATIINDEQNKYIQFLNSKGIRIDRVIKRLNHVDAIGATWKKIHDDIILLYQFIRICRTYYGKEKAIKIEKKMKTGKISTYSGFTKPDIRYLEKIRGDVKGMAEAFDRLKVIFKNKEYGSILMAILSTVGEEARQDAILNEYFNFDPHLDKGDAEKIRAKKIKEFEWMQKILENTHKSLMGKAKGDKRQGITPEYNFVSNIQKFISSPEIESEDSPKETKIIARIVRQELFNEFPLNEERTGDELFSGKQRSKVLSRYWAKDIFKEMEDIAKGAKNPQDTYLSGSGKRQ